MIKFFDAFGHPPSLYLSHSSKYKTNFGGLVTLILLIITTFSAIYFGQELVKKESPSVNFSLDSDSHPKNLYYFNEFEFIFTLQDKNEHPFIDRSIYFPEGYILKTTRTENGLESKYIPINISRCSESLPTNILFSDYDLTKYYCLSKNQTIDLKEIFIGEFWGNNNFQLIQIRMTACNKGKDTSICADDDTIAEYLQHSKFSLYTLDTLIQTRNHENPFEHGLSETFYYVSKDSFLSVTQFLKTLKIETDDGLLFQSERTQTTFSLGEVKEYSISMPSYTQFLNYNIQFTNIVSGYYRKYKKLQDIAANVGGIFKMLMAIGSFIVYPYYKNSYSEHLINNFFSVSNFVKPRKAFSKTNNTCGKNNFLNHPHLTYSIDKGKTSLSHVINNRDGDSIQFHREKKREKDWIRISSVIKVCPIKIVMKLTSKKIYGTFYIAMRIIYDYLNVIHLLNSVHDLREMKNFLEKKYFNFRLNNPDFSLLRQKLIQNKDLLNMAVVKKSKTFIDNIIDSSLKNNSSKNFLNSSLYS